jgi:hypothetical protein
MYKYGEKYIMPATSITCATISGPVPGHRVGGFPQGPDEPSHNGNEEQNV